MKHFTEQLIDMASLIQVQGVHPEVYTSEPGHGARYELHPHQVLPFHSWLEFNPFAALARGLWALTGESCNPEWVAQYDPVMRNDLEMIDDLMTCPSSIGHHFPTIVRNLRNDPFPIIPQRFFVVPPQGSKPGITADVLTFSATHSRLSLDAYISWADLSRLPILMVQLSMLLDVCCADTCLQAGRLNLNISSLCATELLVNRFQKSVRVPSVYEEGTTNHFPAAEYPDVNILSEVNMLVDTDKPPPALQWPFLRKIAVPMFHAFALYNQTEERDTGAAVQYLQDNLPINNDWRLAGERWFTEQIRES